MDFTAIQSAPREQLENEVVIRGAERDAALTRAERADQEVERLREVERQADAVERTYQHGIADALKQFDEQNFGAARAHLQNIRHRVIARRALPSAVAILGEPTPQEATPIPRRREGDEYPTTREA